MWEISSSLEFCLYPSYSFAINVVFGIPLEGRVGRVCKFFVIRFWIINSSNFPCKSLLKNYLHKKLEKKVKYN